MTDADVATGRVVAKRYVVGRLLGSGSMGTVRAAFDRKLEREVAIKFVSVETLAREEAVERFRREIDVVTRLRSEHVVRVLDVGTLPNGLPFMVMELLVGRGLDEERELRGVIPVDEAVSFVLPVIEVLAEAHASGVVHRDIKPANLFLEERPDGRRRVKVLDFGVSRSELAAPSFVTEVGTITGSPLYMAPEQLRSSETADARADIWSLGAILFELVTGFTAHDGDSVADVCATLLRDPPRRITDFGTELPGGFVEVVMRCLEPDRERRYSSVAELGAALLPFSSGGVVHVDRAREALARRAPGAQNSPDRVPASDAPVTVELPENGASPRSAHGARPARAAHDDAPDGFGKLRTFRMAVAFTFVGLGVGTAFLLDFPREAPRDPVARPAATPVASPLSAAPVATNGVSSAPSVTVSPVAAEPSVEPMPAAGLTIPGVAPSIEAKRSSSTRRPAVRKWTPKRKSAVGAKPPATVDVTDFGGRR